MTGPRVLLLDIETAPILAYVWSLWQQDVGLNQIKDDWFVISWAAKWLNENEVMYRDQRKARVIENDKPLLKPLWKLLDEADIIITQNGKSFDSKKLNARFVMNGFIPPSPYRHIDTKILAKRHFAFTSNRLEYMTDKLNVRYKKLKHKNFPGFELWRECLAKNPKAWNELERYNKHDVLSLEELYHKLSPWDSSINFNTYTDHEVPVCQCGCPTLKRDGFAYTNLGKFQRYRCTKCGSMLRDKANMLTKGKKESLKAKV